MIARSRRESAAASVWPELRFPPGIVVGRGAAMTHLYRELQALCDAELPVLVVGETGVGKEHVARTFHRTGPRADRSFETLNCAALPPELLEAELFGIGHRVATGVDGRRGCFERAAGGTLFLDEVGELPPALQCKLLRVLQDGEIQPVGRPPKRVDVTVLSATNRDLETAAGDGAFRRDLYYRVAGATLTVPPLRERGSDDIVAIAEALLARFSGRRRPPVLGAAAIEAFSRYSWPGNVRELEHEVRRLAHRWRGVRTLEPRMLAPRIVAGAAERARSTPARTLHLRDRLDTLERELIAEALTRTTGNRTRAAALLGVSRQGLLLKLRRLGLDGPVPGDQPAASALRASEANGLV